ncbi:MAG: response regulator [Chitinophagales bacterium]
MLTKKQILIIDDDNSTRLLLQYLLAERYRVIGKTNGLEGMIWLNAGNIPDLILLDINMPELNGKDFLRNLRLSGFFSKIPILILSSETHLQEIQNFISPSDILGKPFVPDILFKKIKRLNV